MKLAPERVDVFLLVGDTGVLHQVVARGGMGAIGTDEEVKVHFNFDGAFVDRFGRYVGWKVDIGVEPCLRMLLKPGYSSVEICAGEFVVEVEGHVVKFFESVEQSFIEP